MLYTSFVWRFVGFVLPLLFFSLTSCESRNPVEKYGDDVTRAYTGTKRFADQVDIKSLQDAVRSFYAVNGRYPDNIKELEHYVGIPLDSKYHYDPSEGTIEAKR